MLINTKTPAAERGWVLNPTGSKCKPMNIEDLETRKQNLIEHSDVTFNNMQKIIVESERVENVAHNSEKAIALIDAEFESQTKLNKTDFAFLFFATALQCIRQYFLTDFKERVDSNTAAKDPNKVFKKLDKRIHLPNEPHPPYEPSYLEISSTHKVPFDVMRGSSNFGLSLNGINHREKTLGHDPVLGWIFGTSNIVTDTITVWDIDHPFPPLKSFHIGKAHDSAFRLQDTITAKANTAVIFKHMKSRLIDEKTEGKKIVGFSIFKEYIHLKSDINSFKSLPIPIIHRVNPELANQLASYGIDTGSILNVGKQAAYAEVINMLIGMIHYLCYDKAKDGSLNTYSIRTNKLITLSNILASASNVLIVLFSSMLGNEAIIRKLDIGGFLVTLHRLISDEELKNQIKAEFIKKNFIKLIRGE